VAQTPRALDRTALGGAVNRVSLPFLRVQERRLLLATVDALAVGVSMMAAYSLWKARVHPAADNMASMPWAWVIGGAGVWLAVSWLAGAYDLDVADRLPRSLRITFTVALVSAGAALAGYWLFLKTYPRPALALAVVAAPALILGWRSVYAALLRRPSGATRALLLGTQASFAALQEATAGAGSYQRLVGFVAHDVPDARALGAAGDLLDVAERHGIHRVVVAPRLNLSAGAIAALTSAVERGIEVLDFNTAYEELTGKIAVEHVGDQWLAALPTRLTTSSMEELSMRALDLLGAIIGLGACILLFPVIGLLIRLTSPGPIIYRQERLGRGGRRFIIHKFRSMRVDAEASGPRWAREADARVTSVGRLLRRTHLDELPQLWNVLRGDMSLVGPRPERPEFTNTLSREIPFYRLRLAVRPGLTGLKQLKVGYAASVDEHLEVLRHDLYYIKHRSLPLNLAIIARTIGTVVGRTGR